MLTPVVATAINRQMSTEFYSAYLYFSMAAWCERRHYPGFGHWLRQQAAEELGHGMRLLDFLNRRGAKAVFAGLPRPPGEFESLSNLCHEVWRHEKEISAAIFALNALAVKEQAFATQAQLIWFFNEQVEEEHSSARIAAQVKLIGDDPTALLVLDRELGQRPTATSAAPVTAAAS
jgi:ferritin